MWLVSFDMYLHWPVVTYQLFELPNIADMWVYSLFTKFSMVCYFISAIFKVAYSMLCLLSEILNYFFLCGKYKDFAGIKFSGLGQFEYFPKPFL